MVSTQISRLALYGAVSTTFAGYIIANAFSSRPNFYSAAVSIGRSTGSLLILANFALFNAICAGVVFKTIFFGSLRTVEYEHLFEKLWIFLTESLLALTIFKEDFSIPFAMMYGVLLFLKCFHWITADRVDYMDQIPPPGPPLLFHLRTSLVILFLSLADFILVLYSLESILLDGVSAMVLFSSEFLILSASIGGIFARYVVGLIDLRRARGREDAPSWEEKSMWLFYIDLGVDFVKLLTYLSFFTIILLSYALPLHILRDVYMTLRSFISRVSDLLRYRRATRDMDAQYPNATSADLERGGGDKTCIICREEMIPFDAAGDESTPEAGSGEAGVSGRERGRQGGGNRKGPNETPKRLACGHIFHFHCLRSWLERQQSCPTCRRDVLSAAPTLSNRRRPGAQQAPPAAPGVVPQANGHVPAAQGGQAQNPNPIQAIYEQYFRPPPPADPPGANVPAPTSHPAVPSPQTDPTRIPNGHSADTGESSRTSEADTKDLVNGIWGGPITPGRFFASPLGQAPAWPPSSSSSASTSMMSTRPFAHSSPASVPPPRDPTPNTAAPITHQPIATSSTTIDLSPQSVPQPETEPTADEVDDSRIDENQARRAAAEAAMRRSGGTSNANPQPSLSAPNVEIPIPNGGNLKGKAKATSHSMEEARYVPYLSEPSLSNGKSTWNTPKSRAEAREALRDRIRVLRDTDETLWRMIGDLTEVQSQWEAEDVAADAAGGVKQAEIS